MLEKIKCPERDSNPRHSDFMKGALDFYWGNLSTRQPQWKSLAHNLISYIRIHFRSEQTFAPRVSCNQTGRTVSYRTQMLYGSVSQGLGTTKFTNLIGWNGYWPRSRFSHLDRHLDRECFKAKKLQAKMQNYWLLSSKIFYFYKCPTAAEKKK